MNSIKLKNYVNVMNEKVVAAAFYPGHLLEITSANKVQKHSGQGQNVVPVIFPVEDEHQGKSKDDAYAVGDVCQVWQPTPGDEVLAVLADGESVVIGDALESNGDGTLRKHVPDTETIGTDSSGNVQTIYARAIVGVALEAIDLSDSSGGETADAALGYDKRIKILIG